MNKITLIAAASALLLTSGAWANGNDNSSGNSAMDCVEGMNPGQTMRSYNVIGKDKDEYLLPPGQLAPEATDMNLGEVIQEYCSPES